MLFGVRHIVLHSTGTESYTLTGIHCTGPVANKKMPTTKTNEKFPVGELKFITILLWIIDFMPLLIRRFSSDKNGQFDRELIVVQSLPSKFHLHFYWLRAKKKNKKLVIIEFLLYDSTRLCLFFFRGEWKKP